jgi:hypothetical protein
MQSDPPPPSGGGGALGWGAISILGFAVAMRCRKRRERSISIGALLTAAVVLVGCGRGNTDVQSPPGGTSFGTNATPSAVALAQKAGNPS